MPKLQQVNNVDLQLVGDYVALSTNTVAYNSHVLQLDAFEMKHYGRSEWILEETSAYFCFVTNFRLFIDFYR